MPATLSQSKQKEIGALSAAGLNNLQIQEKTGLTYPAVRRYSWTEGTKFDAESIQVKRYLVSLFEDIAVRSLVAITPEKITKSSAYQLNTMAAMSTDKRALLLGELDKPIVQLQIVGLSQDEMKALTLKDVSIPDMVVMPVNDDVKAKGAT